MADMLTCPHCQSELSDSAIKNGICPSCGKQTNFDPKAKTVLNLTDPEAKTVVEPETDAPTLKDVEQVWEDAVHNNSTIDSTLKSESKAIRSPSGLTVAPMRLVEAGVHVDPPPHYELIEILGQGGMGVVYTARQGSLGRTIAMKMIKGGAATSGQHMNQFLSEAAVTGDLAHPNIVPIYDLGANEQGELFYAMKKVEGTPWDEKISKNSLPENLEILMRVADAVSFAHSRGVIHRDLKPENTMLGEFGEVLVMDWGLAASVSSDGKAEPLANSAVCGTPAYMAPEMALGDPLGIGTHSDVYLLGAILYEIVTGLKPHTGNNVMECIFNITQNTIQESPKKGELIDIALKAMATSPSERYASIRDFQNAIRDYQEHSESIVLTARANEDLKIAENVGDYSVFARSLFGYEEALKLWEGNASAAEGRVTAALQYATCAHDKGDLDLAASLLSEDSVEHRELITNISKSRHEREIRQRRLRTFRQTSIGLAAAVILLIAGVWGWFQLEANRVRSEANKHADSGWSALSKLPSQESLDEKEEVLLEAEAAFREALFMVPGVERARKGMRVASLHHFELALRQENWRQAREKLLQAYQVGLLEEEYNGKKKILSDAEQARERYIRERVSYLLADSTKISREVSHELARQELVSMKDSLTVNLLRQHLDKDKSGATSNHLAIDSLAWLGNKDAAKSILPYIQAKVGESSNPLLVQESAICAICILGPDDPAVHDEVKKRLWEEPDGLASSLYDSVRKYYAPYAERIALSRGKVANVGSREEIGADWFERGLEFEMAGEHQQAVICLSKSLQYRPKHALTYSNLANSKIPLGDYDGACEDATKAISLDPLMWRAFSARGQAKHWKNEFKGALKDFEQALMLFPQSAVVLANRGLTKMSLGDFEGAIEDLDKAIRLDQTNAKYYCSRGNIRATQGKHKEAILNFDKAIALNPKSSWIYACRGGSKRVLKDYQGAIRDYDKGLEIDPKDAMIYQSRARAKEEVGDLPGALQDINNAIALKPKSVEYIKNRASFKLRSGDPSGSVSDYDTILKIDPMYKTAYLFRGYAKQDIKDHKGAIVDFTKCLEACPEERFSAYAARSRSHFMLKNIDGAIQDLDRALELNPRHAQSYHWRGVYKASKGLFKEAIGDYDKVIAINPKNNGVYYMRGDAKKRIGDSKGAIIDFSEALKLENDSVESLIGRANARLAMGDLEAALLDFNKALELKPMSLKAMFGRGRTLENMGNLREGIAAMSTIIASYPKNVDAYYFRGNMRIQSKNIDGAIEDFDVVLRLNPKDADASKRKASAIKLKKGLEGAIREADAAIALNPKDISALFERGLAYDFLGDHVHSLQDLDEVIKLDPKHRVAYHSRAEVKRASGNLAGALKDYDKARELLKEKLTNIEEGAKGHAELTGLLRQIEEAIADTRQKQAGVQ